MFWMVVTYLIDYFFLFYVPSNYFFVSLFSFFHNCFNMRLAVAPRIWEIARQFLSEPSNFIDLLKNRWCSIYRDAWLWTWAGYWSSDRYTNSQILATTWASCESIMETAAQICKRRAFLDLYINFALHGMSEDSFRLAETMPNHVCSLLKELFMVCAALFELERLFYRVVSTAAVKRSTSQNQFYVKTYIFIYHHFCVFLCLALCSSKL